ncbi:hypothetical protein [Alkalicoccus chagannorensis]|uniref:hypothetical protein n=1 Tax=Alkalicoccus chagannorensis TaxID=427072 RepID=UPI000402B58A|nr:hypothetical protein [Alkalicoccus chagannorensis]
MKGYIKDYRKELESEIWLMPPLYHRVWQFLKYKVNHKENVVPMSDGSTLTIQEGQHLTSVRKIAKGIGYYEQGAWKEPNPKTIQRILDWLKKKDMISISTGHGNSKYTLITLTQWESYQSKDREGNSEYTASTQLMERNKNEKNEKNEEKKESPKLKFETHHLKLAELLFKKIKENDPGAKEPNLEKWAHTFRLMMERDDRPGKEIQELIMWSQDNDFWKSNILSASKLREKYSTLKMQREYENNKTLKLVNGGKNSNYDPLAKFREE